MVLSMTGFASKTVICNLLDGSKVNVLINVKTLNSRFFETTCKLSYPINHLETKLISLLKAKLLRGHTYITMHIVNPEILHGNITPSVSTIQGYMNAIDQIKKTVSVEGALSVSDLLRLPNVFETTQKEIDKNFEKQLIQEVEQLADKVVNTREQEGSTLKKDLEERFTLMKKEMTAIEKSSKQLMQNKKQEITQMLQELEANEEETFDSRKNALYISLDKMDIHEEIVRFKSHLENITNQISSSTKEKGKRLDFTLQELAREINTLSSRCSDAGITSQAINIKVELEKAREQTQNIV
ncbi:DUF1732 domain-containing protein [bacterium]|nr:DUF1732 domain-containing protein [bacterium]